MDVRIGVTNTVKEIDIELPVDADRDKIRKRIDEAAGRRVQGPVADRQTGRDIAVPSAKIAYVELGGADGERRIGFGAA